jgi:hypothetical protein
MVLVMKELHQTGSCRSLLVALELDPEQLDHVRRVFRAGHPAGDPAGFRQAAVGFGATGGDHLVVQLARQRQVGQAVAVDVASGLD